jgi:hypothetical protein
MPGPFTCNFPGRGNCGRICPVENEHKGIGTIDALTSGFNLIARRPWAILLPVAVNLFTWLGPRLTIVPLVQQTADALRATATLQSGQYAEWVQSAAQVLADLGNRVNLFDLLAVGVPALPLLPKGQAAWLLDNWLLTVALVAVLLIGGTYLMALYLLVIARQVRDEHIAIRVAVVRAGRIVWRVAILGIVLLGIVTLVSLPGMTAIGMLSLFSPQGTAILSSLLLWAGLFLMVWLLFYLFFVLDAIVLDDAGARQAVARSVALVRQNTGPTVTLILLTVLLGAGLGEVWNLIAKTTLGTIAAIIANAYVASALTAASLIFYNSRWHAFEKKFGAHVGPLAEGPAGQESTDRPGE